MAVTHPHDQITQCLQVLSETQCYIRQQVQDLQKEKAEFDIKMGRKELDFKRQVEVHGQRVKMAKEDLKREVDRLESTKQVGEYAADTTKRQVVTIDVGGEKFYTDIRTLERQQESLFPLLVKNIDRHHSKSTYVFIDRDSKHFRFILNYMRQGEEVFFSSALRKKDKFELDEMICEAKYYRLNGFIKLLERHKIRLVHNKPATFKDLYNEKYFIAPNPQLKRYETSRRLLFQKHNMTATVFENVHFKHFVSFEGSILDSVKFIKCQFDAVISFVDADISHVHFDNCVNAMPDRLILDGTLAKIVGVTFIPPVDLSNFSIDYTRAT